jgi:hypothetical protein
MIVGDNSPSHHLTKKAVGFIPLDGQSDLFMINTLEAALPHSMRHGSTMLATVFGVLGFKESLAVQIEIMLVPVFGPLSFERFDLCSCRDDEPAQNLNHRSDAHPRHSYGAEASAFGADEKGRRNMSFGPDLLKHRVQTITQPD